MQKYSLHDGPGIRTLVFFQGCPLRCTWCSNPESQAATTTLLWHRRRCIACLLCKEVCPSGAISQGGGALSINRDVCTVCGKCEKVCYAKAMELSAKKKTVDELMKEINKDVPFYGELGGVTLSGGEASAQWQFAAALLDACQEEGISTSIETCGFGQWENLREVYTRADLILFDIKHMDTAVHTKVTGVPNEIILENCKKASLLGKPMVVRIPVIPTINDSAQNLQETIDFVESLETVKEIHLLAYHNYGSAKYEAMGIPYTLENLEKPTQERMEELAQMVENAGFLCKIGG